MKNSKTINFFFLCGALIVAWVSLLIAPFSANGLVVVLLNLEEILKNPFSITFCNDSFKCLFIFELIYLVAITVYSLNKKNFKNKIEYGSASFGDVGEINKKYQVKIFSENKILTKNCRMGWDDRVHKRNVNTLVVGASGTGKTRCYIEPNILQCNGSMIILDPKGEILKGTKEILEEKEVKIKTFNCVNMEKSCGYNPFEYFDDDNCVQKFVSHICYASSEKGSKKSDPFWDSSAENLLMALVLYIKYEAKEHEKNMATVMNMLKEIDIDTENPKESNFIDALFERLEMKSPEHIAVRYYKNFRRGTPETIMSIKQTLISKLHKFNLDAVRDLTMSDDLDLKSLGKEKQALFIIISDNDSSFNFLVSILYTQLFDQLFKEADQNEGGRLSVPCHFFMDEFANITLPKDFCRILSVMRSRGISTSIILQNLAQLKDLFGDQQQTIIGNCDSLLFLGSNELSTLKYICEMLGKETIDFSTSSKQFGKNHGSIQYQITGRNLMTIDELRCLDNRYAILFIRGERPIIDLKYDLVRHPSFLKQKQRRGRNLK